jgi:hypothetical protein
MFIWMTSQKPQQPDGIGPLGISFVTQDSEPRVVGKFVICYEADWS